MKKKLVMAFAVCSLMCASCKKDVEPKCGVITQVAKVENYFGSPTPTYLVVVKYSEDNSSVYAYKQAAIDSLHFKTGDTFCR